MGLLGFVPILGGGEGGPVDGAERLVFAAMVMPQGLLRPDAVNATAGRLARWKGRHVTVTVSRYVKSKTNPQLALFHGPVLDAWCDYTGYDPAEMKKELKLAYLKPHLEISRLTGEETTVLPSLAELNVEEMTAFLERVLREGRIMGIEFKVDAA